ncbi:MAG: 6-phosphofructokinase [Candidatus Omnitrophota bacterium]
MKKIKKIALLTSGGDASGMNTAIRSTVRTALYHGVRVFGVLHGYTGLIKNDFVEMNRRSVSNIMMLGGTMLKTARSDEFKTIKGQRKAVKNLKKRKIDGLVVIGGDGSFRGAHILSTKWGIRCIGVPATIDNDISGTDFTIGSDTAVGVALDAIDKIRDTVTSLERIFVVEVMGRECGYIAMRTALAGGAEEVLLPDVKNDLNRMCREIKTAREKGKISWIVIVAEGAGSAGDIARIIKRKTGYETRVTVLGHIQRGGRPTAIDRILASRLGSAAVMLLIQGETDKMVGIISDQIESTGLSCACEKKNDYRDLYSLLKILET